MKQIQAFYVLLQDKLKHVIEVYGLPFWTGLTDRERYLLKGLALCVVLLMSYLVYMPLKNKVLHETTLLAEKQKTLAWMQSAEKAHHNQAKSSAKEVLTAAKALSLFSQSLDSALHDFPYELQQLDETTLQLSFQKVPYQLFMQWLEEANKRSKFTVKSFSAQKSDESGLAQLSITLSFSI